MSSGYFPVSPKFHRWGRDLSEAKRLISGVVDGWMDSRGDLTSLGIACDHSNICNLRVAVEQIDSCLRIDESDPEVALAQLNIAFEKQRLADSEVVRWQAALAQSREMASVGMNDMVDPGTGEPR